MKNHIITIFLLVLVVTLCASTIFLAFGIVFLRKSNAEIIKEADSDKLSLNEEITELKESFYQNSNPISQIIDEKKLLTHSDIMTMINSHKFKQVYQGDIMEKKDITVMEYACSDGYMFVYLSDVSGASTVNDIIFYDYTWRRYIVDTLLVPLNKQNELTPTHIFTLFGEPNELPAIPFSGYIGYQWSIGDGYSYFVSSTNKNIKDSMLVCPDGSVINIYPIYE